MKAKHSLTAISMLAASSMAAAEGSVTIYGVADVFAGQVKTVTATPAVNTKVYAVNSGGMTTSFLGFRGQEDLGDGLRAVFWLESFIRMDTGATGRNDTDTFWARNASVGLENSGWGRLTLGQHVTPYSLATTVIYSPFTGSTTFSTAFAQVFKGNVQGDTRFKNSIRYTSPGNSGFVADMAYTFGDEIEDGPNRYRNRGFDGTFRYTGPNWSVGVGTRLMNLNSNDNGRDQKAFMLAGNYDFKVVKLFAQAHSVKEDFNDAALNVKRRTYEVGTSIPVGDAGEILATFARTSIKDNLPATSDVRRGWSLAYDYNFSKRTDAYVALYSDKQYHPQNDQQIAAVGLRHKF